MEKTKRKYDKPSMKVYELKQRTKLLNASGGPYPGYPDGGNI